MRKTAFFVLFALWLILSASPAWASVANCVGSAAAFPTQPPAITGTGSLTTPSGGFSPGCIQVDKTFSNFTSPEAWSCTATGLASCPTDPGTGGTYALGVTTGALNGLRLNTIRTGDTTNNWGLPAAFGTVSLTTSYNFGVTSSTNMDAAVLRANVGDIGGSGTYVITLKLCPGTTTFNGSCSGLLTTSLTFNDGNSASGDTHFAGLLFGNQTQFGIQVVIQGGSSFFATDNLNWVEVDFGTPEPASYVLFSGGLAALGLLYRRRRASIS